MERAPRTADGRAFRFRAGRPSLDLCSTLLWRYRSPIEQLRRPEDLGEWLTQAALCAASPDMTGAELEHARALREALYRLLAGRPADNPPDPGDLTLINAAAARPGRAPRLTPQGLIEWVTDEPVAAALAEVARDGIDLFAGPFADRVRECAAPDCAFLFVDTSRPGNRRWCAMNRCGNRQHVRQHRARRSGLEQR